MMNELVIIPKSLEKHFSCDTPSANILKVLERCGVCTTIKSVDDFKYFVYDATPVNIYDFIEWAEDEDIMLAENIPQIIYVVVPRESLNDEVDTSKRDAIQAALHFILGVCEGVLHTKSYNNIIDRVPRIINLGEDEFVRKRFEEIFNQNRKTQSAEEILRDVCCGVGTEP